MLFCLKSRVRTQQFTIPTMSTIVIWVRKPFFRAVVDRFSVWQRRNALSGPNNLMKPYTCRRVESKETGEEVRYNSVSCKYISVLSTCNVVLHI